MWFVSLTVLVGRDLVSVVKGKCSFKDIQIFA